MIRVTNTHAEGSLLCNIMNVSNKKKNNNSGTNSSDGASSAEDPTTVLLNNDKDDDDDDDVTTIISEPSKILQLIEKLSSTTNSIELQIIINNHVRVNKLLCVPCVVFNSLLFLLFSLNMLPTHLTFSWYPFFHQIMKD